MLNSSSPGSWRVGASTSRVYSIKTESARNPRVFPCSCKQLHEENARRAAAAIRFAHASGSRSPLCQLVTADRPNQLIIPSSSSQAVLGPFIVEIPYRIAHDLERERERELPPALESSSCDMRAPPAKRLKPTCAGVLYDMVVVAARPSLAHTRRWRRAVPT